MAGNTGFSDSWEQLIRMAGQGRQGPTGLRGAPCGTGLKHNGDTWTRAAGSAEALRHHMSRVRAEFAAAHAGVGGGTEGLAVTGVLQAVRGSWERRIGSAIDECGRLAEDLRAVARDQGENEAEIKSSFAKAGPGAGSGAGAGAGARGGGGGR